MSLSIGELATKYDFHRRVYLKLEGQLDATVQVMRECGDLVDSGIRLKECTEAFLEASQSYSAVRQSLVTALLIEHQFNGSQRANLGLLDRLPDKDPCCA